MAETWVWRRIQKSGEAWSRQLEYEDSSTSDPRALLIPLGSASPTAGKTQQLMETVLSVDLQFFLLL